MTLRISIVMGALAVAAVARAQDEAPVAPAPPACPAGEQACATTSGCCPVEEAAPAPPPAPVAPAPVAREHHRRRVFAPGEVAMTAGAGVSNYFGSAISGTDAGAAWNARVTVGVHSPIALEASYIGASNSFDVPGAGGGHLTSHGVDGDLRLQLPTRVQPYVFGGVGYNHVSLESNGSPVLNATYSQSDNQVTVPAGGGLTAYIGKHATLDARGTYRFIPDNGLTLMSNRHLHQWLAQANIGYAF